MRKMLLTTAAMVSLAVGLGGIAAAQSQMGNESGKGTSGAPTGTMPQKSSPSTAPSSAGKSMGGQPAQSMEKNGAQNERLGQSPSDQQKGMTRGTQEEQRPKGAQEERGAKERGVQEEQGKTGVNGSERSGQSRRSSGASVDLSQDQRTRIQGVIAKEHAPRFNGSEHFDITGAEALRGEYCSQPYSTLDAELRLKGLSCTPMTDPDLIRFLDAQASIYPARG